MAFIGTNELKKSGICHVLPLHHVWMYEDDECGLTDLSGVEEPEQGPQTSNPKIWENKMGFGLVANLWDFHHAQQEWAVTQDTLKSNKK